jgi:zinc/manganese transport system permease protein
VTPALSHIFEPGFFGNDAVHTAATVGGVVALVCGAVGVFTVIRGQAFAGEALGDVGAMGGSAAFLTGVNPLFGFVGVALAAAGVIEVIGFRRPRGRDLATGIVLGAGLGLAALFLYLDTTTSNTSGASNTILFGSIFIISKSTVPLVIVLSAITLAITVSLYRMLLLSSLSTDLAAARGVSVRLVGAGFLVAMAVAVALAAMTIGAVLSTALLVGPAATALRLTRRPGVAVALAGVIGVGTTWLGILLAYDSYYWPPVNHGWPVSFFVVALIFVSYVATHLRQPARRVSTAVSEDLGL